MDQSKIVDIFRQGNLVIPLFLLKNYNKFHLTISEFLFLMYLYNKGDKTVFNPEIISADLSLDLAKVMEYIASLGEKHLLSVDTIKNEKGLSEDIINLDNFYHKITSIMTEEIVAKKDHSNSNIFGVIEKEFGRTLSPMEYEIIKAWLDNNMSEEIITEALKEATFNGVSNLRYIDKILYEWEKRGIKTKEDVVKNKMKHRRSQETEQYTEIFDYDWFDDDE